MFLIYGLFLLGVVIYSSCDNRKFISDHNPVPVYIADSVHFDLSLDNGDSIKTYNVAFGGYTWRFSAFQKGKKLNNEKFRVVVLQIDSTGTQKYNNSTFTDSTLVTDNYYSFKYYPNLQKGWHKFSINILNGHGTTFKDTVRFFVDSYRSIPFQINTSPKNFPCVRPTSTNTINFNLAITSSDLTNSTVYKLQYTLPSNTGTATFNPGKYNSQNETLSIGNNPISIALSNYIPGTYKLPLKVIDPNGDFLLDTVTYVVKTNVPPTVSFASTIFSRSISQVTKGPTRFFASSCGQGGNQGYNISFVGNLYNVSNTFNINTIDDGEFGTGPVKVVKIKLRVGTVETSYNVTGGTSSSCNYSNGTVKFDYPYDPYYNILAGTWSTGASFRCDAFTSKPVFQAYTDNGANAGIRNLNGVGRTTVACNVVPGSVVYISVQDSEGAWSQEFGYNISSDNNILTGPKSWVSP